MSGQKRPITTPVEAQQIVTPNLQRAGGSEKKKKKNNTTPKKPIALTVDSHKSPGIKKEKKGDLTNSKVEADKFFQWLIAPHTIDEFYNDYFEKKPLYVKRNNPAYFSGWFCKDDIDLMLSENSLKYTKNLDGKRATLNAEGRAYPAAVWKAYSEGCSVRLLNPQTFHTGVWKMLSILQEHFLCFAGANIYLTPKGAQGFSPHYDDVEVFVLQLEGAKTWRLYDHPQESDVLARESSPNFEQNQIGEPYFEETLQAGDLLYLPRGTIHQAVSPPETHSLHLTVSTYQKNAWIDLLELALPQALQAAAEEDVDFRRGLPRDFLTYMGVANQTGGGEDEDEEAVDQEKVDKRAGFVENVRKLLHKLVDHIPLDGAADQLGVKYHHSALPPVLLPGEEAHTIVGRGIASVNIFNHVRLVRAHAYRIVVQTDFLSVHFHTENGREYQAEETQVIEFGLDAGPGLEYLLDSYEHGWVAVKSIPVEGQDQQVDVANALYERGLLMVKE